MQLKPTRGWPPGGFPFVDPKSGMAFEPMSADLQLQTQNVIKHRRANPSIYPPSDKTAFDPLAVQREIIEYICRVRPSNCTETVRQAKSYFVVEPGPPHGKKCLKCQSENLVATYCKSCGGRKITSWKCTQCGFENPK